MNTDRIVIEFLTMGLYIHAGEMSGGMWITGRRGRRVSEFLLRIVRCVA